MALTNDVTEWVADRPKLMGALWMLLILFSEVGHVVASGDAKAGP